MSQPYGTYARSRKRSAPALPTTLAVTIHGRHDLEQFSLELQKLVARLQEQGVYGVQACTLSLEPLDDKVRPKVLWDAQGAPIAELHIAAPPAPPLYRTG